MKQKKDVAAIEIIRSLGAHDNGAFMAEDEICSTKRKPPYN